MSPQSGNRSRRAARRLQVLTAGAAACLGFLAAAPLGAQGLTKAVPIFVNGQAQLVPAFQDASEWIRQELWVETEFDSDGDGKRDRMHVDVTRPRQTETEGLKVAVVYESSPYFSGTSGARDFLWNVQQEVGADPGKRTSQPAIPFRGSHARISNSEVNTWVPRGFAVVHSEAPGTGLSQGCPTIGGPPERLAPKAVIDWLNGRARGYSTATGTEEVKATWSTGRVGMTGTSYNGTIPLAAAVTGVRGLEAIIPIAPNTSYYHYYRSNGLVRHPGGWLGEDIDFLYDFISSGDTARREYCNRTIRDGVFAAGRDRASGDYNEFWAGRDLLPLVKNIRAAVLMSHGFNDWNVVPEHSVRIYEALKELNVPHQAYYHQGEHGGPPPLEMRNRWFSHFLYGVQNGVEAEPRAWIVREGMSPSAPTPYDEYPNPAAELVALFPGAGGHAQGALSLVPLGKQGTETLVDDASFSGGVLAAAEQSKVRLLYATPELVAPVHLSGWTTVTLRMASSKPAANLSVWMVTLPWTGTPTSTASLITRGWADPQNAASLTKGGNYDSMERGKPLEPGKFVTLTFSLEPDDQVIPAGKRIGLMVMSSDREFTLWPKPGTELTVDLDRSSVTIPVVGGSAAFFRAFREQKK
jgi:X-Pro dipeptidyl-peptidase